MNAWVSQLIDVSGLLLGLLGFSCKRKDGAKNHTYLILQSFVIVGKRDLDSVLN